MVFWLSIWISKLILSFWGSSTNVWAPSTKEGSSSSYSSPPELRSKTKWFITKEVIFDTLLDIGFWNSVWMELFLCKVLSLKVSNFKSWTDGFATNVYCKQKLKFSHLFHSKFRFWCLVPNGNDIIPIPFVFCRPFLLLGSKIGLQYSHQVKVKLNVKNLIRMQIAISAEIGLKVGYWLYTVTAYLTTGPYLNLIHNWLKYTYKLIVNRLRMICAIRFNWKLLFYSCLAVHKKR